MANYNYFEKFDNNDIDESILHENVSGWDFEDHYWHFACLALYYKNINERHLEKECLSKMCDMNYVFNAFVYYNSLGVLPLTYKKYITKFKNDMVNEKIDKQIEDINKAGKRKQRRKYFLSSLVSLITIPLMLFLMLVCHLDSSISIVISIFFLLMIQFLTSPLMKNTKINIFIRSLFKRKKKIDNYISKELNEYYKYLDRFVRIVNNEYYLALVKSQGDEEQTKKIVRIIKEKKLNI